MHEEVHNVKSISGVSNSVFLLLVVASHKIEHLPNKGMLLLDLISPGMSIQWSGKNLHIWEHNKLFDVRQGIHFHATCNRLEKYTWRLYIILATVNWQIECKWYYVDTLWPWVICSSLAIKALMLSDDNLWSTSWSCGRSLQCFEMTLSPFTRSPRYGHPQIIR